jgi:hypothetical protein
MSRLNKLTLSTIVLSFFIIIGAGHGIGCVGLLEIVALIHKFNIGTEDFSLSFIGSYDKSLAAVGLFALVGHMLLLISIGRKAERQKFWTKVAGLIFLWTSFYYLTHNIFNDDLSQIGFVTGLPFLIVSIILAYKVVKQKLQTVYG